MPRHRHGNSDAIDTRSHRRIILSACGRGGHGKTHFACTAPRPIQYLSIDPNTRDAMDTLPDADGITLVQFQVPLPSFWGDTKRVMADADEQWKRFLEVNEEILNGHVKPQPRTVVWDTATEFYDVAILAEFGRTEQLQYYQRAIPNRIYGRVLDAYRGTDLNLILLHRLKEEWAEETRKVRTRGQGTQEKTDRVRTGNWERDGFKKIEYIVQAEVHLLKRDRDSQSTTDELVDRFGMRVVKSTRSPQLEGQEWWGATKKGRSKVEFPWLAEAVFEGTTREDWL